MIILPPNIKNTKAGSPFSNEQSDFTRRLPTFLTERQRMRDAKIVQRLIRICDDEKDYRKGIDYFKEKMRLMSDPLYWEALRTIWVLCGSTETANEFRPMMKSKRRCRNWFMTPEDKASLDEMQFPLTVWRAYDPTLDPDPGLSWTTDRKWCEEYAAKKGRAVKERTVTREEVFAYISRRGESEIIIL